MSKQENFLIISSYARASNPDYTSFSTTSISSSFSSSSFYNPVEIPPKRRETANSNVHFLPSVNVLGVFEARFFVKVDKINEVDKNIDKNIDVIDEVDEIDKANEVDELDKINKVNKQTSSDYEGINSRESKESSITSFALCCQLIAYPEGNELQTSTPISTKIINDLTDSFVSTIVAHIRKLCYLDYPCRLFHKVLTLKPEILEILEKGEKIEILKLQLGKRFDPTDPTFFFVDEKLYAYFTYNFCAYRKYITALLANDYKKINTIHPKYINNDDATWAITCAMWEQIATEEREALIIFSLFFDSAATFFVNPEPEQAKEAFNSFRERISIWLRDALMPQHIYEQCLQKEQSKQYQEQVNQIRYNAEVSHE